MQEIRQDRVGIFWTLAQCAVYLAAGLIALPLQVRAQTRTAPARFEVYEVTIPELQAALAAGRVTSVQLVDAYLARIAAYDRSGPRLNALIRLSPAVRADAAARDAERRAGRARGPLHGIPVIIKDNYTTTDLPTSAGSIALANLRTADDAFLVQKLRAAGAVILGKSNMHELASGITNISSLGGQTRNPYDPARNPGGSSGGTGAAAAASFGAIAYGSDTCGSIRIPAAVNNLFGLRPTKGLTSVTGIIPLSHTQDSAGPLARTMMDLAIGLDAIIGADPADPATRILEGRALPRFVEGLDSAALRGARLGLLNSQFGNQEDAEAARIVRAAVERMKQQGAVIVDAVLPAGIDSLAAVAGVIDLEFKFDLQDFLARLPDAPVRSLSEILERGLYHSALEAVLQRRDTVSGRDTPRYRQALAQQDTIRRAVLRLLEEQRLDALIYPTLRRKPALLGEPQPGSTCFLSAVTGLPALSAPAGFTADGLPVGLELLGAPLADVRLAALAFAYEQAVKPRRPPYSTPALNGRPARPLSVFTVTATAEGTAAASTRFTYDPARGALTYVLRVSGIAADDVLTVALTRGTPQKVSRMLHHLAGPGLRGANGTLMLSPAERADLLEGRMYLSLYTRARPRGLSRTLLELPALPK